jgi:hypothetical protein
MLTPQDYIDHCLMMHKSDPNYAPKAAKYYAGLLENLTILSEFEKGLKLLQSSPQTNSSDTPASRPLS